MYLSLLDCIPVDPHGISPRWLARVIPTNFSLDFLRVFFSEFGSWFLLEFYRRYFPDSFSFWTDIPLGFYSWLLTRASSRRLAGILPKVFQDFSGTIPRILSPFFQEFLTEILRVLLRRLCQWFFPALWSRLSIFLWFFLNYPNMFFQGFSPNFPGISLEFF